MGQRNRQPGAVRLGSGRALFTSAEKAAPARPPLGLARGGRGNMKYTALAALAVAVYIGVIMTSRPPPDPLMEASFRGNSSGVRALLAAGRNPSDRDAWGNTPLHWASKGASETTVSILLENSGDASAENQAGTTPLHWAASSNFSAGVIKALIGAGANPSHSNRAGETPLHWAVDWLAEPAVSVLLASGAQPRITDENKNSPLHNVPVTCHDTPACRRIVAMLLRAGADASQPNAFGRSPLQYFDFSKSVHIDRAQKPKISSPSVRLASGHSFPLLGLGTWQSPPGRVRQAVRIALQFGYRHIDAASRYGNEKEVGQGLSDAIKAGVVKREDVFITSKLWNTDHEPHRVIPALKKTLNDLGVTYLDLYLVHWPTAFDQVSNGSLQISATPNTATWTELERAVSAGLVRSIGLSNFNKRQIREILSAAKVPPSVLQIESNPYLPQQDLNRFAKENDIVVTAYSPLGSNARPWRKDDDPVLLKDPNVLKIAKKHDKSPAQIAIRFQLERGVAVIPKSINPTRIRDNFDVLNFALDDDDMATLNSQHFFRSCVPTASFEFDGETVVLPRDLAHPEFPFEELIEKFAEYREVLQERLGLRP